MKNALKYIVFTFFIAASAFYFTSCDIINGGKGDENGDDGGSVSIDFLDDFGVKSGKPAGTPLTNVGLTSANIDAITAITGSARAAAAGYYGYYVEDETLLLFFTGITETTRNNVVTFLKSNIGSSNFGEYDIQEGYGAAAYYGVNEEYIFGKYVWQMLYTKKDFPANELAEFFPSDIPIPKGTVIPKGTMMVAFDTNERYDYDSITITGITGNYEYAEILLFSDISELNNFSGNDSWSNGRYGSSSLMFNLEEAYGWKGYGSYYILLDSHKDVYESYYIYTDGKTFEELGITDENDLQNLPKYNISTKISTIPFSKFFHMSTNTGWQ